eukprot:TRINITY_DN5171_c0_g1_i2.p1 TRINITY_DN5171_c0_g1~~TRINITY_DN5171_c0_g1_i2.p1  ORF type:complete len:1641 (-),score=354.50 TRINITY_DN5171_c0_g1_i2:74-4996(-)
MKGASQRVGDAKAAPAPYQASLAKASETMQQLVDLLTILQSPSPDWTPRLPSPAAGMVSTPSWPGTPERDVSDHLEDTVGMQRLAGIKKNVISESTQMGTTSSTATGLSFMSSDKLSAGMSTMADTTMYSSTSTGFSFGSSFSSDAGGPSLRRELASGKQDAAPSLPPPSLPSLPDEVVHDRLMKQVAKNDISRAVESSSISMKRNLRSSILTAVAAGTLPALLESCQIEVPQPDASISQKARSETVSDVGEQRLQQVIPHVEEQKQNALGNSTLPGISKANLHQEPTITLRPEYKKLRRDSDSSDASIFAASLESASQTLQQLFSALQEALADSPDPTPRHIPSPHREHEQLKEAEVVETRCSPDAQVTQIVAEVQSAGEDLQQLLGYAHSVVASNEATPRLHERDLCKGRLTQATEVDRNLQGAFASAVERQQKTFASTEDTMRRQIRSGVVASVADGSLPGAVAEATAVRSGEAWGQMAPEIHEDLLHEQVRPGGVKSVREGSSPTALAEVAATGARPAEALFSKEDAIRRQIRSGVVASVANGSLPRAVAEATAVRSGEARVQVAPASQEDAMRRQIRSGVVASLGEGSLPTALADTASVTSAHAHVAPASKEDAMRTQILSGMVASVADGSLPGAVAVADAVRSGEARVQVAPASQEDAMRRQIRSGVVASLGEGSLPDALADTASVTSARAQVAPASKEDAMRRQIRSGMAACVADGSLPEAVAEADAVRSGEARVQVAPASQEDAMRRQIRSGVVASLGEVSLPTALADTASVTSAHAHVAPASKEDAMRNQILSGMAACVADGSLPGAVAVADAVRSGEARVQVAPASQEDAMRRQIRSGVVASLGEGSLPDAFADTASVTIARAQVAPVSKEDVMRRQIRSGVVTSLGEGSLSHAFADAAAVGTPGCLDVRSASKEEVMRRQIRSGVLTSIVAGALPGTFAQIFGSEADMPGPPVVEVCAVEPSSDRSDVPVELEESWLSPLLQHRREQRHPEWKASQQLPPQMLHNFEAAAQHLEKLLQLLKDIASESRENTPRKPTLPTGSKPQQPSTEKCVIEHTPKDPLPVSEEPRSNPAAVVQNKVEGRGPSIEFKRRLRAGLFSKIRDQSLQQASSITDVSSMQPAAKERSSAPSREFKQRLRKGLTASIRSGVLCEAAHNSSAAQDEENQPANVMKAQPLRAATPPEVKVSCVAKRVAVNRDVERAELANQRIEQVRKEHEVFLQKSVANEPWAESGYPSLQGTKPPSAPAGMSSSSQILSSSSAFSVARARQRFLEAKAPLSPVAEGDLKHARPVTADAVLSKSSLCRQAMLVLAEAIWEGRLTPPLAPGPAQSTVASAPSPPPLQPLPSEDWDELESTCLKACAPDLGSSLAEGEAALECEEPELEPEAAEADPDGFATLSESWLDDLVDERILKGRRISSCSDSDAVSEASTALGTPRLTCMIPDVPTARTSTSAPTPIASTPRLSQFMPTPTHAKAGAGRTPQVVLSSERSSRAGDEPADSDELSQFMPSPAHRQAQATPRLLQFMPEVMPPRQELPWVQSLPSGGFSRPILDVPRVPMMEDPSARTRPQVASPLPPLLPAMPRGSAPQAARWLGLHQDCAVPQQPLQPCLMFPATLQAGRDMVPWREPW